MCFCCDIYENYIVNSTNQSLKNPIVGCKVGATEPVCSRLLLFLFSESEPTQQWFSSDSFDTNSNSNSQKSISLIVHHVGHFNHLTLPLDSPFDRELRLQCMLFTQPSRLLLFFLILPHRTQGLLVFHCFDPLKVML